MPRSTPPGSETQPFPVREISSVDPRPPDRRWTVEHLWTAESVGLIASNPKEGKTWLAIELALAVATGGRALGHFSAHQEGPVLFFGAEDDPPDLRVRFDAVAEARGIDLERAPLFLLDVPVLKLNRLEQIQRLRATVADVGPRLLVLDPYVRISDADENSSAEVSGLLGSLRALQREFQLSVVLVHHMRKAPSRSLGQRLRGSSDFAAWFDSALYLTKARDHTLLSVEHRRAPAPGPFRLKLVGEPVPHLQLEEPETRHPVPLPNKEPLHTEILDRLSGSPVPIPTRELRRLLGRRKTTVIAALRHLEQAGHVEREQSGWKLVSRPSGGQATLFPCSEP